MKRLLFSILLLTVTTSLVVAQDKEEEESKGGFKKENLFTGGGVSLGFGTAYGTTSFGIGASPIFGYSITKWLDAGVSVNYNYQSSSYSYGEKYHQTQYGGGTFIKIYPISFLFAQAQVEHNFSTQKNFPGNGQTPDKFSFQTNSFLIGGGYASRVPESGQLFFYLSVLFDISGNPYTPYTDGLGHPIPTIRGGVQIPLFQGKRKNNYEEEDRSGGGSKKPRNYNRY
ncbi:MAG: hypothetical protein ABUT20_10470 [Bacteroidota bacterium]